MSASVLQLAPSILDFKCVPFYSLSSYQNPIRSFIDSPGYGWHSGIFMRHSGASLMYISQSKLTFWISQFRWIRRKGRRTQTKPKIVSADLAVVECSCCVRPWWLWTHTTRSVSLSLPFSGANSVRGDSPGGGSRRHPIGITSKNIGFGGSQSLLLLIGIFVPECFMTHSMVC